MIEIGNGDYICGRCCLGVTFSDEHRIYVQNDIPEDMFLEECLDHSICEIARDTGIYCDAHGFGYSGPECRKTTKEWVGELRTMIDLSP